MVKKAQENHWPQIRQIYIDGIKTGNATFAQASEAGRYDDWKEGKVEGASMVYLAEDNVLGWASLSHVSDRCVYAGVAEVSVYVAKDMQGKGIGSKLVEALIEFAEKNHIWTLQAGIFPENLPSIKLHKKYGFREVEFGKS